ncbi:MAG: haloacid dehalogenase type II [Rhodobacteraceae bacterium]|nr:haloacid dehalogenase type II [Paracoccaceae bacterium]
MRPAALIFDVFGTLVDWRGSVAREVGAAFRAKGIDADPHLFADHWRAEYDPSMAPVRAGRRDYVALDDLHLENLQTVLARLGLDHRFDAAECRALATAWERLDPWADVAAGLAAIRQEALVAPCSNGSVALMARLARHAGLHWDAILGAEIAHNYKPHPSVYQAACAALRLRPDQVMMVAAHNGDLEAAAALGLQTAFICRPVEHGAGQSSDLAPSGDWTLVADDLVDLAARL